MDLGVLILGIVLGGILSYFVTKGNKKVGAYMTILVSLVAFLILFINRDGFSVGSSFYFFSFKMSSIGWYFSMIMLLIYVCVAFFNPFWMEKLLHPAAYNFLYLLSLAGTLGLFFSTNFLGVFICWEIVVWSSLFIIPLGKSRKASVLYYGISAFGSFAMLYGILLLYAKYQSFDISYVLGQVATDPKLATLVFFIIIMAAITKLGIFPFH
ncbi:MAG: hypothetical protein MUO60_01260, partial [Clostridiaceae bacterium]|nr:hypothetical protein [Clostridiaceae bacterium]